MALIATVRDSGGSVLCAFLLRSEVGAVGLWSCAGEDTIEADGARYLVRCTITRCETLPGERAGLDYAELEGCDE